MRAYIYVSVCMHIIQMCVCVCEYAHIAAYIGCMYMFVCLCVYIHINLYYSDRRLILPVVLPRSTDLALPTSSMAWLMSHTVT